GADYTHPTFWDLNTTANWSGGPNGKFADGDVVRFDDTATATVVDVQGFMTPESVTFDNGTAKPYSIIGTGSIDGATGITKNGNGVVTIASDNTYTGPTTLNTGTFNVNSATALGTGTLVINGGVLDNTSGTPLTLTTNNAQTWNGNVVFAGSNDLNLGSGAVALTASGEVSVTAGTLTVGGVISGTGPLSKSGGGTLTFRKTNTYSGGTTINAGTLTLDLSARSGGISNLGAFASDASGNLEIRSGGNAGVDTSGLDSNAKFTGTGTLTKTGTGYIGLFFDGSAANEGVKNFAGLIDVQQGALGNNSPGWGSGPGLMDLNIAAGALFDMRTQNVRIDALSGTGTIEKTWVPNLNLSIGNNDGSATYSGTIDQTVGGGSGNISLTKNGGGTQTLSGANNYGGGTIINAGTLVVASTTGSATGSGAVTVKSAATLAGTGSIGGNVSVEAGGFVAPGNAGTGTLTVASAALTGTYQCQLDVTSGDQVAISGALTVNPGATIAVSTLGTPAAASYVIASYGSLVGDAPTVTGIPDGYVLDTATAGQLKLVKSGGFSAWADTWPGLTDKTPGGDPDGDGISNLLEYVIGGDPRVSSTSHLPGEAIVGSNLVLSYERSDDSEADTTQTGQWSTNLTDWHDLAPVQVNENDSAPDDMEIRIPLSNAAGGKLFGRLHVTMP
ncbi:MAG: autotransporter-associated beta strand repeat-containing protein, partial [Verrucomicrobia bacterium]|nr:autotransporter-associated beta strand repeat-containing protein [Verrucomicrobiota bacterium]